MKSLLIAPKKKNIKVRKPDGAWLSANGEQVTRTAFWLRRINDGDVEIIDKIKTPAVTSEKPATDVGVDDKAAPTGTKATSKAAATKETR